MKTLSELRDARILFDKKPPIFGFFLIQIVGMFMFFLIMLSTLTPKKYIIKASGTLTNTSTNYVMCPYTGEIDECLLKEGALVQKGDLLLTIKSTDYDLQREQLVLNKESYQEKLEKYTILAQSIREDTNLFDSQNIQDNLFYSKYEEYKSQLAQNQIDTSTYKSYGYSDEQIEIEIQKNQGKIAEIYYNALESAESSKEEIQMQIATIDAQLAALSSGKNAYAINAATSGVVHLLADYKAGMVVQTTTTVATITPENSERILVAYITTADMARISEGDEVQIVVDGLAQSVYGTLSGKVSHIDSDLTTRETGNGSTASFFKIFITVDGDYLLSKSGHKVDLTNGMTAEIRIQYDKVTWFCYVLEKLGFIAR